MTEPIIGWENECKRLQSKLDTIRNHVRDGMGYSERFEDLNQVKLPLSVWKDICTSVVLKRNQT